MRGGKMETLPNKLRLKLVNRLRAWKGTLPNAVYDSPFGNALWERLGGDNRWTLYRVSSGR